MTITVVRPYWSWMMVLEGWITVPLAVRITRGLRRLPPGRRVGRTGLGRKYGQNGNCDGKCAHGTSLSCTASVACFGRRQ